jgi:hypothetical protein
MSQLDPCSGCARHVRRADGACPFCGAILARAPLRPAYRRTANATRAAIFAIGATLASCGGDESGPENESDSILDIDDIGLDEEPETIMQPYGAPPDPQPPPEKQPPEHDGPEVPPEPEQ